MVRHSRKAIAFALQLLLAIALTVTTAYASAPNPDVLALVKLGPRVAGSPATEKASEYLVSEYRKVGYQTEVQPFTYQKFRDLGSSLTLDGTKTEAYALNGSIPGEVTGKLVAIPNFGAPSDFPPEVKGAIALIRRGKMPFSQKLKNAAEAGAIAAVIVNNEPGKIRGTLTETPKIPAITIAQEQGTPLFEKASLNATVIVEAQLGVKGRNIIAHRPGVKQPSLILGGHYDSVVDSPGANDNASGTATVLAIARQFAKTPMAEKIWFMAFDGEEDGLQGSRFFVNSVQPAFLEKLKGMLNFDMVGVNDQLAIDGSNTLKEFAKTPGQNARSYLMGSSDHASFKTKNVPILFFYRGMEPNYHKPTDKLASSPLIEDTQKKAVAIIKQIL
jgi:aminopeptidase YwaD